MIMNIIQNSFFKYFIIIIKYKNKIYFIGATLEGRIIEVDFLKRKQVVPVVKKIISKPTRDRNDNDSGFNRGGDRNQGGNNRRPNRDSNFGGNR